MRKSGNGQHIVDARPRCSGKEAFGEEGLTDSREREGDEESMVLKEERRTGGSVRLGKGVYAAKNLTGSTKGQMGGDSANQGC